jgi:hypothetical protein
MSLRAIYMEKKQKTLPPPDQDHKLSRSSWYRLTNPSTNDLNTLQQTCLGGMALSGFFFLMRPSNAPESRLFRAIMFLIALAGWIAIQIVKKRRGTS